MFMEQHGKTDDLIDRVNPAKILVIVDDNPVVESLFERGTEDLDVDLKTFNSADTAWSYLKTSRPDILFLNTRIPGKEDGLTFLKKLRYLPIHKDTAVVMISPTDYTQDRLSAGELGALDFLAKPIPIGGIVDVVNRYL